MWGAENKNKNNKYVKNNIMNKNYILRRIIQEHLAVSRKVSKERSEKMLLYWQIDNALKDFFVSKKENLKVNEESVTDVSFEKLVGFSKTSAKNMRNISTQYIEDEVPLHLTDMVSEVPA
ncbi:Hypothetical predicted protein [Octopus vulgaris]|uniref:Uncharacterized protein n=1 Tax=Octopus vulgaris TaxID=6645 RepID=A0AA36AKP2_OCTVU|nr:Hypothetical predicted protein [Octopus vulgaris]